MSINTSLEIIGNSSSLEERLPGFKLPGGTLFIPISGTLYHSRRHYHWSSARAHMDGKDDALVTVKPLLELVGNWRQFLCGDVSNDEYELMQQHERTGRPLGRKKFMEQLESQLGRIIIPQRGGRPKKIR